MIDTEKPIQTIEIGPEDEPIYLRIRRRFEPPPPPPEPSIKQSQVELALRKTLPMVLSDHSADMMIEEFKRHMGWS